jgi:mycothiol system anti-sigma-R factor
MDRDDTDQAEDGEETECREALNRLYNFLDGELTPERRQQIQTHLDQCSPCLEAFDFEAELKVVIARRCRDQVPESLRIRVALALADASGHATRSE